MREAQWWTQEADGKILCTLCPRYCRIGEGQPGFCYIRQNRDGRLITLGYGRSTGFAADPIEKKPLNHFLPGTRVLSFGTAGCNLGCKFCQNWNISKAKLDDSRSAAITPEQVVDMAGREGCESIAFTYNDPTIFGEYVIDIARCARERNVRSVMVTAGYITAEARTDIYRHIDAANVDLKGFTEKFYYTLTSSHLEPVLDTLRWLHDDTDVWLEITTLLIPGANDDPEELQQMCGWILQNLGADVPLHFTAFHPDFRMRDTPATPASTLTRARQMALDAGIHYVYTGNVHDPDGQTTWCPGCGADLIRRDWHTVLANRLHNGACPDCGHVVAGNFNGVETKTGRGVIQ